MNSSYFLKIAIAFEFFIPMHCLSELINHSAPNNNFILQKQELVESIFKAAIYEESAAPEKILPHLGIINSYTLKKGKYSHFSISSAKANDSEKKRMIQLGLSDINYSRHLPTEEHPWEYYLDLQIDLQTTCVTIENIQTIFGGDYENLPPRIAAPFSKSPAIWISDPSTHGHEIAGLLYRNLFQGNGEVWITFEFKSCAESISISTKGKP